MTTEEIRFGNKTLPFTIKYGYRKTLGIKVHPEGIVEVLAPYNTKHTDIVNNAQNKASWIVKQLEYFKSFKPAAPARRFINGETHLYLGRQYRLKIQPDTENAIKVYRGQLVIHSKNNNPEKLKMLLCRWYKGKAQIIFNKMLLEALPKFKKYKIDEPELVIRNMSKRWGSCTPSGKIALNTELIKAPKSCIEYVVIHELTHLIYPNHSKEFKYLLTNKLPDWEKRKLKLETFLY